MAGFSYPFDSGPGSTVTEDQWSYLMRDAVGTGVHEAGKTPGPLGTELKVTSLGEGGIVYLAGGRATISGFHYQQSGSEVLTVTANSNPTLDRIDAVVLRLDLDTNTISIQTKLGSPASSPAPPAIATNELLLATYRVRKSSNLVLPNEVEDRRQFIGRRVGIVDNGLNSAQREGDIEYSPTANKFYGNVDNAGSREQFAYWSDLQAHVGAADPHPQYLTEAEGFSSVSSGVITPSPTMTTFATYHRAINLPGGFKVVMFYYYGQFNGADNPGVFTIFTMSTPELRPNFSFRYAGHQYKFTNSSDDIPLVVTVNPSGSVVAGGDTWLLGGAFVLVNGMYFKGTGL